MEANNQRIKSAKGITLIELIMTIALIGIVVIPSSIFIVETIKGAFKSEGIIVAVNLARMELEKTNNMAYDNISTVTYNSYEGYNYDLNRGVEDVEHWGKEYVKEIKIEVYPKDKLGSTEELLTTVITHRAKNVE